MPLLDFPDALANSLYKLITITLIALTVSVASPCNIPKRSFKTLNENPTTKLYIVNTKCVSLSIRSSQAFLKSLVLHYLKKIQNLPGLSSYIIWIHCSRNSGPHLTKKLSSQLDVFLFSLSYVMAYCYCKLVPTWDKKFCHFHYFLIVFFGGSFFYSS